VGLLPTIEQTMLVRAALGTRRSGPDELKMVDRTIGALAALPPAAQVAVKGLRPLLARSEGVSTDRFQRDTITALRTGMAREAIRVASVQALVRQALTAVSATGHPFLVLRGLALAETCYPNPVTRHCHDLDLYLPIESRPAIAGALSATGFGVAQDDPSRPPGEERWVHPSGFPVELHTTFFPERYYSLPPEWVWSGATTRPILGIPVRIPAPGDHLVLVLGLASCTPQRSTLRWVTDSWFLLTETADFPWERFLDGMREARLALPVSVMLTYLSDEVGAPVPEEVLRTVRSEAAEAPPLARDIAFFWANALPAGTVRGGREPIGFWSSTWLLGLKLWPSRAYMAHAYPEKRGFMLWWYFRRLARGATKALDARISPRSPIRTTERQ